MGVGHKVRFEVLRRDGFRCQYCGQSATDPSIELELAYLDEGNLPSGELQVDHVEPSSKGGSDDPLNLVTACVACNSGKSDRVLSDESILQRQFGYLEKAELRRQTLREMMRWKRSLEASKNERLGDFVEFWEGLTHNTTTLNTHGRAAIKTLLNNRSDWSEEDILDAMVASIETYMKFDAERPTLESVEKAFDKIRGVLRFKDKPWMKDLFYIRAILKNNCSYLPPDIMELLEEAYERGVKIRDLRGAAKRATSWSGGSGFQWSLEGFLEESKESKVPNAIEEPPISDESQSLLRRMIDEGWTGTQADEGCALIAALSLELKFEYYDDVLSELCSVLKKTNKARLPFESSVQHLNNLLGKEEQVFLYYSRTNELSVVKLYFEPLRLELMAALDALDPAAVILQNPYHYNTIPLVTSLFREAVTAVSAGVLIRRKLEGADKVARTLSKFFGTAELLSFIGDLAYIYEYDQESEEEVMVVDESPIKSFHECLYHLLNYPTSADVRTVAEAKELMDVLRDSTTGFLAILPTKKYPSVLTQLEFDSWEAYEEERKKRSRGQEAPE